ncbi:MAG: dihydrolipoamide acetyltransferase family protein [Chloroflexi bacterium]|nr:dihydrolipoamide acetyltransferase family protein [Chloroflexota bacterium]
MASDVIMPQMGFDMREGTVVSWLKQEGDEVQRGEPIAEIETDKATVELESFVAGTLGRIYVAAGVTVPVGEVIAVITAAGEELPERPSGGDQARGAAPVAAKPEPATAPTPTAKPKSAPPVTPTAQNSDPSTPAAPAAEPVARPSAPAVPGVRIAVSPVARRLAEEAGLSIEEIQGKVAGTGPSGRIAREDVERYLAARTETPPAPVTARVRSTPTEPVTPPGIVVPQGLSPMRQAIARRMSLSKLTAPHYYVTVDVDMSRAVDLRRDLNAELDEQERISVNDMIIKAVALTLVKHPHFNVTVLPEGIRPNETIAVSIAVAMEDGLIAPSLPDLGSTTLRGVARGTKNLIERARTGRLRPEEMSGIGFTVSNLGMYDVKSFVAIITPPNAGAVAVGSAKATPVVRDGEIVIAQMMSITLSADHRATDGAQGAQFMNELRRLLEKPTALLL